MSRKRASLPNPAEDRLRKLTGLSAEERVLRAKMAAHTLHATRDPREATKAATHASQVTRFERQVDPDGTLEPGERHRRAEHARKAYMAGLSLKANQARRSKKQIKATVQALAQARDTARILPFPLMEDQP